MAVAANTAEHNGKTAKTEHAVVSTERTDVCVVGGGPGGAMLALLLARKGIPVTLLEEHKNFDRDFRGDTIHPSTLEILGEIGLAGRLLQLPHSEVRQMQAQTEGGPVAIADFTRLHIPYPFVALMPQVEFLNFITREATQYPTFRLVMGARVEELIEEDGKIRGVYYRAADGRHAVRARLTVGADGRFSRVRHLAGFEPEATSPPMDVLWFRIPRRASDGAGGIGRFGKGSIIVMLERGAEWQIAYLIPKGGYQEIRAAGIAALRQHLVEAVPELADRAETLQDWKQVALLSVESSRLARWYRRGLLLIGDAAHVMSPVGGVGINYAIQDAVVAANVLAGPLQHGRLRLRDLAEVQRQRELPVRVIQAAQAGLQQSVLAHALHQDQAFVVPPLARVLLRLPVIGTLPTRLVAYGIRHVHVRA